jgi:hypothetical protein
MSATRFFRKVISGDRITTQLQTNIEQAVAEVIRNPLIDGRIITGVSLTSTVTQLEHKLNRKIRGYLVLGNSAAALVYDNLSTEPKPELYLPILSTVPTVVNLWVF